MPSPQVRIFLLTWCYDYTDPSLWFPDGLGLLKKRKKAKTESSPADEKKPETAVGDVVKADSQVSSDEVAVAAAAAAVVDVIAT